VFRRIVIVFALLLSLLFKQAVHVLSLPHLPVSPFPFLLHQPVLQLGLPLLDLDLPPDPLQLLLLRYDLLLQLLLVGLDLLGREVEVLLLLLGELLPRIVFRLGLLGVFYIGWLVAFCCFGMLCNPYSSYYYS
jgi:hypothetical protein